LNNVGGPVRDKQESIRQNRFCMSFENSSYPGYTTEKLMEAKYAGCIPIYWGNPLIDRDFNPRAFINLHKFSSVSECVDFVIELDNNPEAFSEMQREPLLNENRYGQSSD